MDMENLPKTLAEAEIRPGVFLFPGLWEGELREMTTADEDELLNQRPGHEASAVNLVMQSCLVKPEGVNVIDLLMGDRLFLLFALRRLTHGDAYSFRVTCPGCNHSYLWEENLGDLRVQYLPDPAHAASDHRFEFTLPKSGRKVKFRLGRGKDEARLSAIRRDNRDRLMSSLLAMRVTEIEGEKTVTPRVLAELPASDAAALRAEIEARDCGVDTTIEVECPNCFRRDEVELQIDADFFVPGRQRGRRR
ncbi:MAG: hypothetical protein ACM3X6_02820 [Patescibacteria group bacterium]